MHVFHIKNKLGFTLIELLVVVAIIGLLASIISFQVGNTRAKSRDARRVTDMKQIKTGMDLFFQDANGYPDTAVWDANVGSSLECNDRPVLRIPQDPLSGTLGYEYDYESLGTSSIIGCGVQVSPAGYQIEFYMESQEGYYYMDADGNFFDSSTDQGVRIDDLI